MKKINIAKQGILIVSAILAVTTITYAVNNIAKNKSVADSVYSTPLQPITSVAKEVYVAPTTAPTPEPTPVPTATPEPTVAPVPEPTEEPVVQSECVVPNMGPVTMQINARCWVKYGGAITVKYDPYDNMLHCTRVCRLCGKVHDVKIKPLTYGFYGRFRCDDCGALQDYAVLISNWN